MTDQTGNNEISNSKKYAGFFLNLLFFVVVVLGVSAFQTRNMLPTESAEIPILAGPLLDGRNYDLANVGKRPTLVYFFAPWCKFCAASSDNVTRLRRHRDKDSLEILVVALDWKDRDEVRHYVDRHKIELPVLLGDADIMKNWRIFAFPTYYVIDASGRISRRDVGYSTQLGLWWRTWFIS